AATLGSPGQAAYAAANAYLDALAHHRHTHHLPAQSIAWGLWQHTSTMTAHLTTTDHHRITRTGTRPLTTPHALTLLDTAHTHTHPHLIAANLTPTHTPQRRTAGTGTGRSAADWAEQLAALPVEDRRRTLIDLVRTHAAAVLGHPDPGRLDSERGFIELGFDSLTAIELRNGLAAATGLRLPNTLIFDRPTMTELAGHLLAELVPEETDPLAPVLKELDRMERTVLAACRDEDAAEVLAGRLRSALSRLEGLRAPKAEAGFGAATADEIFTFIDRNLGRGRS
ncbi:KR domain-containing protein, partial [Actinomadura sp. 9N215]|uniref:KR domain-containing protein n=1 Tax=Actinomadura sp. 9N215 TaxID=3375150 RepID=UPI0037BABB7A